MSWKTWYITQGIVAKGKEGKNLEQIYKEAGSVFWEPLNRRDKRSARFQRNPFPAIQQAAAANPCSPAVTTANIRNSLKASCSLRRPICRTPPTAPTNTMFRMSI